MIDPRNAPVEVLNIISSPLSAISQAPTKPRLLASIHRKAVVMAKTLADAGLYIDTCYRLSAS
jgi:hypothetical protein